MEIKIPTLRDVARRAGVHPSTVSRALNPETRSRVNAATARRVTAAARHLGYKPNSIARSLRTNRTLTVGMLLPDLTNPLFPPTVRGVEDMLAEHSYTVLLANTDNDHEREARQFEALRARQVEGLLIATARLDHPLTLQALEQSLPVVLLHDVVDGATVHAVVADNAGGTRMGVTHLLELGHRRIAYIAGPLAASPAGDRLGAYRAVMGQRGLLDEDLIAVCPSWTTAEGAVALRSLLDRGGDFTAVAVASDLLAVGCYDVIAERGLSCPDDLSLVGFHDMAFVDRLAPPLTTVRVPHYRIGAEAAKMLLAQLQQRDEEPKTVTVPVEFVARGSTAPPAAGR